MRKFSILVSLLAIASFTHAQTPNMEPPAEITKMTWMVGKWTGSGKMSFQGMETEVTTTMTVSFEGQFLKTVSVNDYGIMKMEETMYIGFDSDKKKYTAWAFTNMSSAPRIEHGEMVGDKMVMTSEPWTVMGSTMVGRGTMEKKDEKNCTFMLEFQVGEKWEPASKVDLKKG